MDLKFHPALKSCWLFLGALFLIPGFSSAAVPPAENILVIYYADTTGPCGTSTYPQQLMQGVTTALGPVASSITLLQIHSGNTGIYSSLAGANLAAKQAYLNSFCQVYDLRFLDTCNNTTTGINTNPDVLTYTGPNSDAVLFGGFLSVGGSLFLQAEHHDYYNRNTNLLQFVNDVATSPINQQYPSVHTGAGYIIPNTAFTTTYAFNNTYHNLAGAGVTLTGNFAGGISAGNFGSGQSLTNITFDAGSGAMALAWQGSNLRGAYGAGKLIVSFETNAFGEGAIDHTYSNQWLQNAYAIQSGCLRYTVDKTFAASTLCVGQTSTFQLCAHNTGTRAIANYSISDTLPTCLTYVGSSPAQTGSAGNHHWWTIANLAAGATSCISVTFTAANITCP
jgi:uncharacterized repeat protein (TIGR01451 family)